MSAVKRTTRTSELSVSVTRLPALQHAAVRLEAGLGPEDRAVQQAWAAVAREAEVVYRNAGALSGVQESAESNGGQP